MLAFLELVKLYRIGIRTAAVQFMYIIQYIEGEPVVNQYLSQYRPQQQQQLAT